MAKERVLDRVYAAIIKLRAAGEKLDVSKVSKASNVARATFYLKDADWQEVRDVINGKPSERVKLVGISNESTASEASELAILTERLTTAENEVARLQDTADRVFRELIDEVQRWFVKASEMPAKNTQTAQYMRELLHARKELDRLTAENQLLKARSSVAAVIHPMISKNVAALDSLQASSDFFSDFLTFLDSLDLRQPSNAPPTLIYVMCGLPLSGKSRWIENHKPSRSGNYLYIDACNHTCDIRRFLLLRLRRIGRAEVHCVWIRADAATCLKRVEAMAGYVEAEGKRRDLAQAAPAFEGPTLHEEFDSIILS